MPTILLVSLLVALACGCSDSGSNSDDAAARDGGVADQITPDGVRDTVGTRDLTPDLRPPDGKVLDGGCPVESDSQFCTRLGKNCGAFSDTDSCGQPRTANCGSCASPLVCGGSGTANVCGFGNANWTVSTIDSAGDPGRGVSLIVDAADAPHVAYQSSSKNLRVAALAAGTWTPTTLETTSLTGEFIDIAFDAIAGPTVAARRLGKPVLWSRGSVGNWSHAPIHAFGGRHIALTYDSAGKAHVCHGDSGGEVLYHSYQDAASAWKTEPIAGKLLTGQKLGAFCDIAVDGSGGVHVSYDNANWLNLGYAFKAGTTGASWTLEVADKDSKGKVGSYTSIALDSAGKPLIAYFRSVDDTLALARKNIGSWAVQTIDSVGAIAAWPSLARDKTNALHVSYYNSTTGALRYARRAPAVGSAFKSETVALVGTGTGGDNDLAVDSANKAHVAFYDATAKALRYAKQK